MRGGHPVLAVIPARGGSKGIPSKNLREVGGMSLTGRAAALASGIAWIDAVVVSTDSEAIRSEAATHGASAPFLRPETLAGDAVGARETWRHAWLAMEAHLDRRFELAVYLEPTSPLRTAEDLAQTMDALLDSDAGIAATVSPNPAHFTPEKTLVVGEDGRLGHYLSEGAHYASRQRITRRYHHRNGICYAARRAAIAENESTGTVVDDDCLAVETDRPVANIDEPFDLELAEWLLDRQESRHATSADSGA